MTDRHSTPSAAGPPPLPPPPPPPVKPPRARADSGATWLGFAVFVVAALVSGLPALNSGASAYQVGWVLGGSFAGLFLAVIVRAVYVRTPWGRGKPEINAAFFLLAAALTLVSITWRGESADEEPDRIAAAAQACIAAGPVPIDPPPRGLRYADFSPAERARLEAGMRTGVAAAPQTVVAKQVVGGGRPQGYVVAVPGLTTDADRVDFEAGFNASTSAAGAELATATVAGRRVLVAETSQLAVTALVEGCWGIGVYTADRTASEGLTAALLSG